MPIQFKYLPARSTQFIDIKERYIDFYESFRSYARELTILAGNSINNESGKADSYSRYLIRLIYNYEFIFNDTIDNINSFESYKKLTKLTKLNDYSIYNKNEYHYPSATLNCYLSYITSLNDITEDYIDKDMNNRLNLSAHEDSMEYLNYNSISERKFKDKKKIVKGLYSYPRNIVESKKAKLNSSWKCEYNSNHETFTNIKNNKPYIEAHHLIPMAAQDYFDYTIDFSNNIICLCPTCHSRIHHSIHPQRKKMIEQLFDNRKSKYKKYGIDIDIKTLLMFYGIL